MKKVLMRVFVLIAGGVLALQAQSPAQAQADPAAPLEAPGVDSLLVPPIPAELEGAAAAMAQGDYASAAVELGALVVRDTANTAALRLLASSYAKLEAYAQAAQACSRLAMLDSADASARLALGYYHQKQGDTQLAELYYGQALALDPSLIQAYQGLGWIYLQRRELEKALDAVTRTTERAPEYGANYILMGRVLTAQGFYENAMRAYERAFLLRPDLRERYGILLQELAIRHEIRR